MADGADFNTLIPVAPSPPVPFLVPPALGPGDRVRVIAPSGPFDRALVLRGIAWLKESYDVEFDWAMMRGAGMFAGPDARRLEELNRALRDPGVRAVIAARGGYGLTRIAHLADLAALVRHPKWLVGFSDFTVLHVEACRAGVASLHAHNVAGLGRGDEVARERWRQALQTPTLRRSYAGLSSWHPGQTSGPLVGGNLTLLFTCAAAGRLRLPAGCVLVLEDVTELSYRIDRMLSALLVGGLLDRVSGVLVGDFTDCPAGRSRVETEEVLRNRLGELQVPVLAGVPIGHGTRNEPLHLGLSARLDAAAGIMILNP